MEIRKINAIRYITPLREGGSLPAVVDADDDYKYVLKFRGAGHGTKMLISELIGGMIAKTLGFKTPELVIIELDEAFGRSEGDEEIQDLLKKSRGSNIGLHFLTGALTYDPASMPVDSYNASKLLWLDAFLTNIDRTVKNTNLLMWHKELWLIDHGASLYFHHSWGDWKKAAQNPFPMIKDHVMLQFAGDIEKVDEEFKAILTDDKIDEIVELIPSDWFDWISEQETEEDIKNVYKGFLKERLKHSYNFVKEAIDARKIRL